MGISTDAIICYGFRLKGEDGNDAAHVSWLTDDDGSEMELDGFIAKLYEIPRPAVYDESDPACLAAWDDRRMKIFQLEKELGVEIVYHCSSECCMYILAAIGSVHRANRGYPVELGQSIACESAWREKIRVFCELASIRFEEPQIILCSNVDGALI